jgi:hypothetical protein
LRGDDTVTRHGRPAKYDAIVQLPGVELLDLTITDGDVFHDVGPDGGDLSYSLVSWALAVPRSLEGLVIEMISANAGRNLAEGGDTPVGDSTSGPQDSQSGEEW